MVVALLGPANLKERRGGIKEGGRGRRGEERERRERGKEGREES